MTIERRPVEVPGQVLELELTQPELLEMEGTVLELWKRGLMFRERVVRIKQEGEQLGSLNKLHDDAFQKVGSFNDEAGEKVNSHAGSSILSKNSVVAIGSCVKALMNEVRQYTREVISTEFSEVDNNSSAEEEHSSDFFTGAASELEKIAVESGLQSSETGEASSAQFQQYDEFARRTEEEIQKLSEEKRASETFTRILRERNRHFFRNNNRLRREKNELSVTVHSLEEEVKQVRQLT